MSSDDDEKRGSIAAASTLVGSQFHARGAATKKACSSIRQHVHGKMRLPDDKECSADHAGTSVTDISKSDIYSGERGRQKKQQFATRLKSMCDTFSALTCYWVTEQ